MLTRIAQNINIILDKKLDDEAILNILQAKLCHIFSFKNIKFKSSENMVNPYPISYYAFNFVPSGGSKNRLLKEINSNLLSWFDDELDKYHKERQDKLKDEQDNYINQKTDNYNENDFKKLKIQNERDVEELRRLPAEISASTQAAVYEVLKMIKKAGYGSALIKNTEFANFYEDIVIGKDKTKKEFLDMLYDLYDGDYDASCAVSTNRENLTGLPVSCVFMSDYELMLQDGNISKSFKSWFKRGMARRSFVYYKKGGHKPKVELMSYEQKKMAYDYLADASIVLKDLYNRVRKEQIYEFSSEGNKAIFEYKQKVLNRINKMFEINDVLDNTTSILRLDIENSTWKIIKLAVLYHMLEKPDSTLIGAECFNKAVEFFYKTNDYLAEMLDAKSQTEYDQLFNYLVKNINTLVNKGDIDRQKFVNRNFSKWFEESLPYLQDIAERKNLGFVGTITGKHNQGYGIGVFDTTKYTIVSREENKKIKSEIVALDKMVVQEVGEEALLS